ncbi:MAG: hypothetical protein HY535_07345 [Chloroflexi bacterium]|nr:hypothetical protein [Chloroflexota bacterium]
MVPPPKTMSKSLLGGLLGVLLLLGCTPLFQEARAPSPTGAAPPTPTAVPVPSPSPTSTPVPRDAAALGRRLLDGRPYLAVPLEGATLLYEPWVDALTVERVRQAYAATGEVLERELGVGQFAAPLVIYLAREGEFQRLAKAKGFATTSFLYGFYSPPGPGPAAEGEVYVDAGVESLYHNLGHELTHAAVGGLPSWLSEGVADYIGTRVELAVRPEAQQVRLLVFRRLVRDAVAQGELMSREEMERFDLQADHSLAELDLFYTHAWQLMEYVAGVHGREGLRTLIATYQSGGQGPGDLFFRALGVSEEALWRAFSADIVDNLTFEEQVDAALCSLTGLLEGRVALVRDWNRLVAAARSQEPEQAQEQVRLFRQRWHGLAEKVAGLAAPGDAGPVRDTFLASLTVAASSLDHSAEGAFALANQMLNEANELSARAFSLLQAAFADRRWLAC